MPSDTTYSYKDVVAFTSSSSIKTKAILSKERCAVSNISRPSTWSTRPYENANLLTDGKYTVTDEDKGGDQNQASKIHQNSHHVKKQRRKPM